MSGVVIVRRDRTEHGKVKVRMWIYSPRHDQLPGRINNSHRL